MLSDKIIYDCPNAACHHPLYTGKCLEECWRRYRGEPGILKKHTAPKAEWVDITMPGEFTPGGNPVYACGRCGWVYGSHSIYPEAKYCQQCGAEMLPVTKVKKVSRYAR